jgi:hypothetical protein
MKKIFLIITINLTIYICNAQIIFEKAFGGNNNERGVSILQTVNEGYVIAGNTDSVGTSGADVFVIMTKVNGDTLWAKTYGSSGDDFLTSIKSTISGGYIISGYTNSISGNGYDAFLLKIDENGAQSWSKCFGGGGDDKGTDVVQNANMQYVLAGSTTSYGAGGMDVYLIATDCNGNLLWSNSFGGSSDDSGNSIVLTSDGGYFISGETKSFGTNTDAYLIRTDVNGNKIWTKAVGGNGSDHATSGIQTADGGFAFTGMSQSWGTGTGDVYVVKTDSLGEVFWTKITGGADADLGNSIKETADGSFIIAGETQSFGSNGDIYLVNLSSYGSIEWTRIFGGFGIECGKSIITTFDGGYAIGGTTTNAANGLDLYLVKTNANGKTTCFSSPISVTALETIPVSISTDAPDSITVFTPSVNSSISSYGDLIFSVDTKCYDNEAIVTATAAIPESNTIVGDINGAVDPNRNSELAQSNVNEVKDYSFSIYPNPNDGSGFNLLMKTGKDKEVLVVVYDAVGRENFSTAIITNDDSETLFTINPMNKLAPGIYVVIATSENETFSKRLIVK